MAAVLIVWEGHVLELEADRTRAPRVEFPDVVRRAHVRDERLHVELADDARVEIEIGARELF